MTSHAPDDDDELELEPVDPEILAHEQQRAHEKTERVLGRVDLDQLLDESRGRDLSLDLSGLREFRFTTRHLLIATACLALSLALLNALGPCNGPFVMAIAALGCGWYAVMRIERRRETERAAARDAWGAASLPTSGIADRGDEEPPVTEEPSWRRRWAVDVAFSTRELLWAVTAATVVLAILQFMGAEAMALVLGLVALLGLVVNAVGYEAPRSVALGWWVLLAMYLFVGLIAAVT